MDLDFDVNKVLPIEFVIPLSASHLYRIGLSHFRNGYQIRNKLHNPLLIAILIFMLLCRSLLSLTIKEENKEFFL